jgi:hypothetical protein
MADDKPYPKLLGALQVVQLMVTIVLAIFAFHLDQRTQSTDSLVKRLDQDLKERQEAFKQAIGRIETELKVKQDERAAQEVAEKLRFQLFTHVSGAIDKKENSGRQQLAARALVVSLLDTDDPLRLGLIQALTQGADPSVQGKIEETAKDEQAFRVQEETAEAAAAKAAATASDASKGPLQKYIVDVFTCEKDGDALKPHARQVIDYLKPRAAEIRSRVLYSSVDSSPGFRISKPQIRHTPDELAMAQDLRKLLLDGRQGDFVLRGVKKNTPNYLSVFVCN